MESCHRLADSYDYIMRYHAADVALGSCQFPAFLRRQKHETLSGNLMF